MASSTRSRHKGGRNPGSGKKNHGSSYRSRGSVTTRSSDNGRVSKVTPGKIRNNKSANNAGTANKINTSGTNLVRTDV